MRTPPRRYREAHHCYEILDDAVMMAGAVSLGVTISADTFDAAGNASRMLTTMTWLRAAECGIPFVHITDGAYSGAFAADGPYSIYCARGREDSIKSCPFPASLAAAGETKALSLPAARTPKHRCKAS